MKTKRVLVALGTMNSRKTVNKSLERAWEKVRKAATKDPPHIDELSFAEVKEGH